MFNVKRYTYIITFIMIVTNGVCTIALVMARLLTHSNGHGISPPVNRNGGSGSASGRVGFSWIPRRGSGGHSRLCRNFYGLDVSFPSIGRKFPSPYGPGFVSRSEQTGSRKQKRAGWKANDDDEEDDEGEDNDGIVYDKEKQGLKSLNIRWELRSFMYANVTLGRAAIPSRVFSTDIFSSRVATSYEQRVAEEYITF